MTVCVSVAVNDCLVFAADSASSLVQTDPATGNSSILNVYQHGDKVYNLHKGLPIAAMTCGMGNIGSASIATLAKDLRRLLSNPGSSWSIDPKNYTIEEVAEKAKKLFFDERFARINPPPPAPHSLEFWIGGYSSDFDAGHEVRKISIVNAACGTPEIVSTGGQAGLFWGGQVSPISRLVIGFDPEMRQTLVTNGVDASAGAAIEQLLRSRFESSLVAPTMPVQDAIDLADFLVETTKRFFRFLPGADIVGGNTDIAVVTKYEGFKWIRRKHFYTPALNPLETDHA